MVTDFDISKNEAGEITHYFERRKAVPAEVVAKVEPLYRKLLQIEEVSGIEGSEKYLIGFLEEQGKDYVEFLKDLMAEYEKEVAQKENSANAPKESKGFFARFFS